MFLFATGKGSDAFSLSVGLNSAVLPPDSHADIQSAIIALKDNHAVLVSDFGKITGILTRHDILEFI